MLRIIYLIFLTFLATVSLQSQCNNELDITVLSTFCTPNADTGDSDYYVYFIVGQSSNTTSFYNIFAGNPATTGQQPYDQVNVVGPVTPINGGIILTVIDGQNSSCTETEFIQITDVTCEPLECTAPPLTLEIDQETICPGQTITYEGANPNLYSREGFQVTEQLSTVPFGENTQFLGTIGGRANSSLYAQPNTWYYVRLAYSLVTQDGPQYDFDCTLLSNVDSFYVGGTDLSHINFGYDLNCIEADLTLTAVPEGPVPPVIVWSQNGNPFSTQNTVTITETGGYTLNVNDGSGCSTTREFFVTDNSFLNLPTEFTIQGCPEDLTYCIFPFFDSWTIEWPEGVEADFNCASNLTPGEDYVVTISNEFGCSESITYTAQFPEPNFLFAEPLTSNDCEPEAMQIFVELSSPDQGIEVSIIEINGGFSTIETYFESGQYIFSDLPPGTYIVDGFTFDQCFIPGNQVTISSGGPRLIESEVIDPLCNGDLGAINLIVEGGQGELNYDWEDLPGTDNEMNRTDLPTGTYSVSITDENDCWMEVNFDIVEPSAINIELQELANANCGNDNGFIGLEITGGNPGPNLDYQVFWSNGWDTEFNQGLAPGDYTVTVTDRNGCTAIETYTIEETGLEVIIDPTVPFITCANPTIQLFGNPGNPDNTFNWTGPNGFTSNESFIDISEPGEYLLEVIDINGCEGISSIVIGDETQAQEVTLTATPITCDVPGSLLVTLGDFSGESNLGLYFVSQDGDTRQYIDGIEQIFEQEYVFSELASGTYEVVTITEYGCQSTQTIVIENQTPIELVSVEIDDIQCNGETGSINVTFNGPDPLTYLWNYENRTTEDLEDIEESGLITLTVTDGSGCTTQFNFLIDNLGTFVFTDFEEVSPICGGNNGALCVIAEGGIEPLTYQWENGNTTACLEDIPAGTYSVTITDANGCITVANGSLFESSFEVAIDGNDPGCGVNNGTLIAVAIPNQQNTTYLWSNGATTPEINNLTPGLYTVTVTNEAGCEVIASRLLSDPGDINFEVEATNVLCDGTLGTFEVQIPEPELALELQIYSPDGLVFISPVNSQSVITVINAPANTYQLVITYPNECSATQTVAIENESSFGVVNFSVSNPGCLDNDGSITIVVENPTPNTTYSWSNGGTTQTIDGLSAGEYFITMNDGADCVFEGSVLLTDEVFYDLDIVQPDCGESGGVFTVNPVGNNELASVLWSNGATTFTVVDLTPGTYGVTVTSTEGCTDEQSFEVSGSSFSVSLAFEGQNDCDEGVVLRPSYSIDIEENELDHQWLLPNGDILNFSIGGLFVQEPGLYTYTATDIFNGCQATATIFVPDFSGECHNLSGRLFADEGNCIYDGTEVIVPSWRVEIEATVGGFSTTAFTDGSGNWNAQVPTGTFTVRALPYVEPLYTDCVPLQTVTVTNNSNAMVDVLMPYTDECASMYANVTIPFLRRCFENEFYIFYCNDGPVVAEDAQLIVEMDPFLDFIEASVNPSNIQARTVTFDLGDLPPFFCGTISVTALVNCDAELGQTHCVEVTATPNDPCPEPDNWNGANLVIDAECDGDEVTFSLKNDGTAPMTVPLSYIVIEDGIMLMEGPQPGPVLEAGESFEFIFPADGSTYYVQANQEPGNPAFSMPTLVVEGCGLNADGNFTTGLVNNLPLGDNSTNWYDISCRQNGGSYDPNAKEGFPLGFGDRNYIAEGTKLTYDIYFQNTGTDTAFTVVIRDTLAAELDPATLRMGAASHAYSADLDSNNVLTITFDNILLPDSNVNLLESQGVVQFTIDHTIGLPMETEIRNDADIYFDFNEPITTNNTLHTLGDDFLPTEVRDIVIITGGLEVYPNPTKDKVNFTLDLPGVGPYQLRLYDAFGRELRTQTQTELTGQFDLSGLPRGWYLLRGENEGQGARAAVRILLQ